MQFRLPFDRTERELSHLPRDSSLIIPTACGEKEDRVSEFLAKESKQHQCDMFTDPRISLFVLFLFTLFAFFSPSRFLWNPFNAIRYYEDKKPRQRGLSSIFYPLSRFLTPVGNFLNYLLLLISASEKKGNIVRRSNKNSSLIKCVIAERNVAALFSRDYIPIGEVLQ